MCCSLKVVVREVKGPIKASQLQCQILMDHVKQARTFYRPVKDQSCYFGDEFLFTYDTTAASDCATLALYRTGREGERERQRERETERERQRERETERQRDRDRETERQRERDRERDRETERERQRETETERGTSTHTHTSLHTPLRPQQM